MKITWFGHSCFRIETGNSVLLIDPYLKGNPSFENSGVSWEEATKGVTHVALTHGHDDHIGDAAEICKLRGATLFAVFELAMHINSKGAEKLEPMNTGGTVRSTDFDLTFTQALHSSSSNGVYLGNPCGIVLRTRENKTLYHMGDTDVFSDMEHINELYKPTIGIVPIGDRFTMGAKSAAYACKKFFNFSTIIPCHYGTFPLLDQTADAFVAEMAGHNVVVPKIGEVVTV
ncbi:MAG: metal-dependent hydrolase [Proteobacteria bacterium]|jgi:Predicted Zn-dependent hydrolases of the beta-lactamase fold|nr:MAG: metal-dependent hydrolase [Pseudomonadota bacterium]